MIPSPLYCNQCGAANAPESRVCWSCQHALAAPDEKEQAQLLKDRYRILVQVGTGGYGAVFKAIDTLSLDTIVAVKQVTLYGLTPQQAIEATDTFNREVHLLSSLQHPNLPRIHDTFTDATHWYLVMDFIEGETLEAYLTNRFASSQKPGLLLEEVLEIGIQLCSTLDYLHTRQPPIIFRDLKPDNIMRTPDGKLRLIDFGIARSFTSGKQTDTMPLGSPGYAAPEQYGKAQTTPQADIYSLGAVLSYLLTGDDPAETPFGFASMSLGASTAWGALDTLMQRMVEGDVSQRPASISEVQAELERLARIQAGPRIWSPAELPPLPPGPPAYQTWQTASAATRSQQQVSVPARRFSRRKFVTRALVIGGSALGVVAIAGMCQNLTRPRFTGSYPPHISPVATPADHLIYRGHSAPVTSVAWSPDGRFVASGSADKTVQIWRAADGVLLYTFYGYQSAVSATVWSPQNTDMCIASCGDTDGSVQVWEAMNGQMDVTHQGQRGRVLALAWSNSSYIASAGEDANVQVWDVRRGNTFYSYRGHTSSVKALINFPLLLGNNGDVEMIASASADTTVQVWQIGGGQPGNPVTQGKLLTKYTGHRAGVNALAVGDSGSQIVSAGDDGTVQVWDVASGVTKTTYRGHRGKVHAVAWSYSSYIASGGDDTTVQVWDSSSGKLIYTYDQHTAAVRTMASSPMYVADRVLSGSDDGTVHLWTIPHS